MNELKEFLHRFPQQLIASPDLHDMEKIATDVRAVVVCGMGGSGIVGNFLQTLLPKVEILVHKGYGFPSRELTDALYVLISYSGETEETLNAFHELKEARKPMAVIAGGGTLLAEAAASHIPRVAVEQNAAVPPRYALGLMLPAALHTVYLAGLGDGAQALLEKTAAEISPVSLEEQAHALAERIKGKHLFLYVPSRMEAAGLYWKAVLNETTKLPVHLSAVPEAHHNEVEALPTEKDIALILFAEPDIHPRLSVQLSALRTIAQRHGWHTENIEGSGAAHLSRMLSVALEGAFVSIALSEMNGIGGTETPIIAELKKYLKDH
jgi:glucose/mannose-6-phosphate isomerase